MALSLLHGGSGFPFLAKSTYDYLCGLSLSSITIVNDLEARALYWIRHSCFVLLFPNCLDGCCRGQQCVEGNLHARYRSDH